MTCMHMHIQVRQQGSLHCRSSSPLSMLAHQGCCCLVLGSQQVSACLMLTQPGCLHVRCLAAAVGKFFASSVLCERDHQSRHCRSRKHQLSQTRLNNRETDIEVNMWTGHVYWMLWYTHTQVQCICSEHMWTSHVDNIDVCLEVCKVKY